MTLVDGQDLTRREWKELQYACDHEHFSFETLSDHTEYGICDRCKVMHQAPIARMIQGERRGG